MKYDEVHFDYAKGHALSEIRYAEQAMINSDLRLASLAINGARPFVKTMLDELMNEGATSEATEQYKKINARFEAAKQSLYEISFMTEQENKATTERQN